MYSCIIRWTINAERNLCSTFWPREPPCCVRHCPSVHPSVCLCPLAASQASQPSKRFHMREKICVCVQIAMFVPRITDRWCFDKTTIKRGEITDGRLTRRDTLLGSWFRRFLIDRIKWKHPGRVGNPDCWLRYCSVQFPNGAERDDRHTDQTFGIPRRASSFFFFLFFFQYWYEIYIERF